MAGGSLMKTPMDRMSGVITRNMPMRSMRLILRAGSYSENLGIKLPTLRHFTQQSNGAKPAEICPHCGGYGVAKRECGSKQCQYCERWW